MEKLRKLVFAAVLVALVGAGVGNLLQPEKVAYAQQMIPQQTAGFSGSVTQPTTSVIVSANPTAVGGPAKVSPPGYAAPASHIHLYHVDIYGSAACVFTIQEHPVTGPNVTIYTGGLAATTPFSIASGNNGALGLNGYLTAAGSSIVITGPASATTLTGTCTFAVE